MTKNIALIPAAGRGTRMKAVTDKYPKAMIPHLGKPIIGHQIDYLIKEGYDKVIIVVGYQKDILMQYVIKNYADKIRILFAIQDELDGLATAILEGINVLNDTDLALANLTILLGDILPQKEMPYFSGESFICYKEVDDWQRWCMVKELNSGRLHFYDKPIEQPKTNKALMGIYMFNNIDLLKESIEYIKEKDIRINGEFQLSSAMNLFNERANINLKKYENFIDFGQAEDISAARKNVARYFNNIKIEGEVVTKSSNDKDKMYDEAIWYHLMEDKIGKYLPKYFGMKIYEDKGSYKISRIKQPSLQEQFIFGTMTDGEWLSFFYELKKYFEQTELFDTIAPDLIEENKEMFINKTSKRIDQIRSMFDEKYYIINGEIKENPLFTFRSKIVPRLMEIINDNKYASLIHGDLFFGNMMFDAKEKDEKLKIIDPRGRYGKHRTMGDKRYDFAKLNHSINGYYDFIVNGLYYLENHNTVINYNFYDSEKQDTPKKIFELFCEENHISLRDIHFLTGILFLSMIPLHKENKNNQIMQFTQAIKFLELGA